MPSAAVRSGMVRSGDRRGDPRRSTHRRVERAARRPAATSAIRCGRCHGRVPAGSREFVDSVVLLLNADYEPLNVCDVRRAFRLVFGQKAEVIQYDHLDIVTARATYRAPSVIRLQHRIR